MSAERRGPAICNVSNIRAGEDGMIKTSNDSQDLRRRIYVKAKAELLRRFWSIRSYAQERRGLGWERWIRQSRKSPQQDRSHKPRHEANGRAQCGKSARCVRCGGDWRRGVVERHLGQSRRACPRPYVCPEKAGVFSRSQSCRGRSQSPVVWIAEERETEPSKPIDKASLGEVTSHRAVTRVNALWPRKCVSPRAEPPTQGRRQNR